MKKLILFATLSLFAVSAKGQYDKSSAETATIKATGAFFAISVADMKESVQWYKEKLGLKLVMEAPKQDKVAVTVLEGSGLTVELIQHDDARPLGKAAPDVKDNFFIHGIFKVGIVVDDFDKTLAVLKERNVKIFLGPFQAKPNQKANVLVKDNSGNIIQFFGR